MEIDPQVLAVILGMAGLTYATRTGGLLLMRRVRLSRRAAAGLRAIPGAVLVALVVPAVFSGGLAELGAALVTVLVAARTRSLLPAMLAGVGVVWALRMLF